MIIIIIIIVMLLVRFMIVIVYESYYDIVYGYTIETNPFHLYVCVCFICDNHTILAHTHTQLTKQWKKNHCQIQSTAKMWCFYFCFSTFFLFPMYENPIQVTLSRMIIKKNITIYKTENGENKQKLGTVFVLFSFFFRSGFVMMKTNTKKKMMIIRSVWMYEEKNLSVCVRVCVFFF